MTSSNHLQFDDDKRVQLRCGQIVFSESEDMFNLASGVQLLELAFAKVES